MRTKTLEWVLCLLLTSPYCAIAQTTNATCISNSTTSWLFNADGHSPCLAWSRIQSLCLDSSSYINVPPLLDPTWSYDLPHGSTICQCNAVTYSLMAGCAYCQVGEVGTWATEQQWRDVCGEVYTADGLGFTQDVEVIPAFAWRPWDGERWSPAEASQSAGLYATATPSGSTTLSRSLPAVPTQTASPTSPNSAPSTTATPTPSASPDEAEPSPAKKWGPIVGGIAGGVVALVLLIFLYRYISQQRKSKAGGERTEIVRYNAPATRAATTRSRATSFFSMFGGYASPRGGRARDMKRETELIADPMSFADPRPAPKAPVVVPMPGGTPRSGRYGEKVGRDSNDSLAYTTTQQRLKARNAAGDSDNESEIISAVMPGRTLIVSNAGPESDGSLTSPETPPKPRGVLKKTAKASAGSSRNVQAPPARPPRANPPPDVTPITARQDFSQPRPYSDAATLPSLYDPPTGAPTYRGTMHSAWTEDTRPNTLSSPNSHYPPTNRDSRASTIGAALGSGRAPMVGDERYWSRQKLPPVPGDGGDGGKGVKKKAKK